MDTYNGVPLGVEAAWPMLPVRRKKGSMRGKRIVAMAVIAGALAAAGGWTISAAQDDVARKGLSYICRDSSPG